MRSYWRDSREPLTSIVLVMPLFLVYHLGILATGGVRNGADFVSSAVYSLFDGDMNVYLVFNAVVLFCFGAAMVALRTSGTMHPRLFPWLLLESTLYALSLGTIVMTLIRSLGLGGLLSTSGTGAGMSFPGKIVMAAGAGLYEEIVFRALLMTGLDWTCRRVLAMKRGEAAAVGFIASSVLFAAAHHLVEPFTGSAFLYRMVAGMVFASLYLVRGLAVVAYTHALYDVFVLLFRQA